MTRRKNRRLKRGLFIRTANKTKRINTSSKKNYRGGVRL